MKQYEEIRHGRSLLAIVVRAGYKSEEIVFFTPDSFSQQLGFLPHKKGKVIKAHVHCKGKREITLTRETIFIRKGKVRVNLFSENRKYAASTVLKTSDVLLLVSGGHEFKILEDTEMFEVKQGPHLKVDKIRFEGIETDTCK